MATKILCRILKSYNNAAKRDMSLNIKFREVLRRDEDHVLRKALKFEVDGRRKRGRPMKTWKRQVLKDMKRVGLTEQDALNRGRWREGVKKIASG